MIPEDPYGEIQMLLAGLPDSATTILAKSKEFRAAGDIDFAFELLERAVEKDAAPVLLVERADLLASEGRTEEAVAEATRALEGDPSSTYAREVLRRALFNDLPESDSLLARVASQFEQDGDVDFAEELLRGAVDREPGSIMLREQLAQSYANQRRVADCIVELKAILRRAPNHDQAQLMLGAAYLKEGNLPGAQKVVDKMRRRGVSSELFEQLEAKLSAVVGVISKSKN